MCDWQSGANVGAVTEIVKSVDGAELLSNVGTELTFRLPMHESAALPAMLSQVRHCVRCETSVWVFMECCVVRVTDTG